MVRHNPHRLLLAITLVIAGAAGGWVPEADAQALIFADGFESGDLSAWDFPPPILPTVVFLEEEILIDEADGIASIELEVSFAVDTPITVEWYTTDDTAVEGTDYSGESATLIIAAQSTTGFVEIPILDDEIPEIIGERFWVQLRNPTGAVLSPDSSFKVVILDDDLPEITIEGPELHVTESEGWEVVHFYLSQFSPNYVHFDVKSTGVTAADGEDFRGANPTLGFLEGSNYKALPIKIYNDEIHEPEETFEVEISNPRYGVLGTPTKTTITIEDDDPPPAVAFVASEQEITEQDGEVEFEVSLSTVSGVDVFVDYETFPGSADDGEDFVHASGTLFLPAMATTRTFPVEIKDDEIGEYEEEFTIVLDNPLGATLGDISVIHVKIGSSDLPDVTRVSYSVGDTASQIEEPFEMSISDGVATFVWEEEQPVLEPGQELVYGDPPQSAFVVACEDEWTCSVSGPGGGRPPNVSSTEVFDMHHPFGTLAEAIAESGGSGFLETTDLASSRIALDLVCYGTGVADTDPVFIDGWTTHPDTPITIRSSDRMRHKGRWDPYYYHLEVEGDNCIHSTVGDVFLDGLQLHCSADPGVDLAAVVFEGSGVHGEARISRSLIRLDNSAGAGDRIGISVPLVNNHHLQIVNSVVFDLGSGTDRHAGVLVEDATSVVNVVNSTVLGGEHGLRRTAGTLTAVNTLVSGTVASAFDGEFTGDSRNNASSDSSAPGPGSAAAEPVWIKGPLSGLDADLHLNCDPLASASVTHSEIDLGESWQIFDDNLMTGIRTTPSDKLIVVVEFDQPIRVAGTMVGFGYSQLHRWSLVSADSVEDVGNPESSSYRQLVSIREVSGVGLPDPLFVWDQAFFGTPEVTRVFRLEVEKLQGDDHIFLGDWKFLFARSPCDGGVDLRFDPKVIAVDDIDGDARAAPWDIGADEASYLVPSFVRGEYLVWEEEDQVTLEVSLRRPVEIPVTFEYRSFPVSAQEGEDYSGGTSVLTIPAGQIGIAFSVEIHNDGATENAENFRIEVAEPGGEFEGFHKTNVVIRDGSPPPGVFFSQESVVVSESAGEVIVNVVLAEEVPGDVVAHWVTLDSTALTGVDFGGRQGAETISQGETSAEIKIPILNDDEFNPDRIFLVALVGTANGSVRTPSRVEVTIVDDDGPAFSFENDQIIVAESDSEVGVAVNLSLPVTELVSVDVVATDESAVLGEDYATPICSVVIAPGATNGSCTIELIDDSIDEYPEVVTLTLSNPVGAEIDEPKESHLVIEDDDPEPEVSFSTDALSVSEGEGSADASLILSEPSGKFVVAEWVANDGSAVSPSDYGPVAAFNEIQFVPGQVLATISIPIVNDVVVEDDEVFSVDLLGVWDAEATDPASVVVTITNDDVIPEVRFAATETEVSEGTPVAVVDLEVVPVWPENATVGIEILSGSATAGGDFDGSTFNVPLPANQPVVSISIPLFDDNSVEDHETFTVRLINPANCVVSQPSIIEVKILDDDLVAVIGEPEGRVYGKGDVLVMDGTASTIPPEYETWFAVLRNDGSDPMEVVHASNELSDTFVTSENDPTYLVRLVAAAPGTLPDSVVLRGAALPCSHPVPDFGCTSAEVVINRADLKTFPFRTSYVFPEAVLLVWGGSSTPSMELERSADGGETWTAFDEPGNQDHDGGQENYTSFPDRTVEPATTYYYRIKWNTYSEWFYLGNSFKAPGDPVTTPVWTAPRPVPTFEAVEWDCPDGASPFLCLGTVSIRLDPEPGETLAGSNIRVYLNENTFEARNGADKNVPIIWPETFPFAGRDEPGCVDRKSEPDLVIEVPVDQASITIELAGVHYGANSFRFEVNDGLGGFSERALLYGIHDVLGVHHAPHKMLVPLLFGTDVTVEDFQIYGLGPVGIRSPDCVDGDWRMQSTWPDKKNIYTADLHYIHATAGNVDKEIGTDEFGFWTSSMTLSDGSDHRLWIQRIYTCHPEVTGHIGRSILGKDGLPVTTTETAQEVCGEYGPTGHDPLHVDMSLEGPHPPVLDFVPSSLFTLSDAGVTNLPIRFRVTDLHHDVDLNAVTITNESMEPPSTVYGYYADDQKGGENGDWGWFVADVPMMVPLGETTLANDLRFQISDQAGNTLDQLTPVVREGPLVWAEIAQPEPPEAEPRQIVIFDGSASIVPYLDDLGGGVARWFFFVRVYGEWEPYRDPGFADGSPGLIQTVEMPRESALKARLIVAASLLDIPSDPWDADLECGWNIGDGRCDTKEVIVALANPGCVQSNPWFSVIVDSDVEALSGEQREELHFDVHAVTSLSPIAYRWAFYDRSDVFLEFPVGDLSHPLISWSPQNHDVDATAEELGLREGDYFLRAEARYPDDGCDEDVSEWKYGRSAVLSVRINHSFRGVAPGEIVEGSGFRVYSSSWEVGQEGFVFIDDVLGDETPPMVYSGVVELGGYVRVLADPFDVFAKAVPWFVSLSPDEEGVGRSIWWGGLKVTSAGNEDSPLVIDNEEDISCGGVGTECAHSILPGQTIRGNWHGPGDDDQFSFFAGAGTRIRVRLERADSGASPQHPDSPAPEIFVVRPDGLATAYSGPLGLDDSGTMLQQTLTLDGRHHIAVRTSKGSGDYLLSIEKLAEGGNGAPAFGWTDDLVHITTEAQKTARMRVPVLDDFGNPLSGVPLVWHQGSECGVGDFCPNGVVIELPSPYDGGAYLKHDPLPGESNSWRPDFLSETGQKHSKQWETVTKRIADARRAEAVFGRVEVFSNAVGSVDLPKTDRAEAVSKRMQIQTSQIGAKKSTKDEEWCRHGTTCGENSMPVFQAVRLDLDEGQELVDIELRILEGGAPIERLDDREVMTDVSLTVEADAVVRDEGGGITRIPIDQKIEVTVVGDRGGAIDAGGAVCESLPVMPGSFTFRIGSDAGVHYVYDEPDGGPCCWIPTEYVVANVVANASVDFGQGETMPMTISSNVDVESIPRPSDPCDVRFYPTDQPVVNTNRYHASQQSGDFVNLGYAYLTDACGNVVHGVGMDDSEEHNQPGDAFRIVSPPEPPEGGFGVWAAGHSTPDEWRYLLALRGRTSGSATQIPDGTYTIDFEVVSQSQCSDGGFISESLTLQALESVPRLTFHWDWDFDGEVSLRGNNPRYSAIAPGSTVRDASDRIAVWRVPAYDDPDPDPEFEGPFTAVPVKIYVADVGIVPFDWEGNVRDTYLEPVEGVVLCTGVVEEMTDDDGKIMTWQGPVQSSCDQTWTTIAEGFASSDPQLTGNTPHSWIPMGLGVGIVKAPEQTGSYVLVVEPQDESFRRGDSWRIDSTWLPDNFMKFDVGGGVYLDEEYERFGATIDVLEPRQIYVQAKLDSLEPTVSLNVEYTDPENKAFQTATVTMNRVGLADEGEGESVYLSEVIDLVLESEKDSAKGVNPLAVKIGGKLESWFGDKLIAVATIENDGPVDLDIDGDNNNGSGLPDRSPREEDLETEGYGKFVFVNHNDDDGDGVPDYADPEVDGESNLVPVVLTINIPNVEWADVSVSFEFDGLQEAFNTEYPEIEDPREDHSFPTGFWDYRNARRTGDSDSVWSYPQMRLWAIDDPMDFRLAQDLVFPGRPYSAIDLGFGNGQRPNEVILYVEGLNQATEWSFSPQSTNLRVDVQMADNEFFDVVALTVVEANLGVNNSSHEPFEDEFTNYGTLRPGVPDVDFVVDQYDEIVEDQGEGFVFWKPSSYVGTRPIDMFPIVIKVPVALNNSGYDFFLRSDPEEAGLLIGDNFSSTKNPLGFINEELKFLATKSEFVKRSHPISDWSLPREQIGTVASYLLYPKLFENLTTENELRVQLIGRDRAKNEFLIDSFRLTLKPLIWRSEGYNELFWMGSARGEPSGSYNYPGDLVAGSRNIQEISVYPKFEWLSGPTPDDQKENFLLYVHGFNINVDEAFRDSAEIFKRMWWAGYRGNFVGLTWHGDEWDPFDHACDLLPEKYGLVCVARFFPNMENAMQTSPRFRQFLVETIAGDWEAKPENVYLMVHSLGNLMTLDALRLHSVAGGEKLIENMISVEAAVWQETLWNQGPIMINGDLSHSEEELMKESWAFWFNQNENSISTSFGRMYNSFTRNDEALVAMKINDLLPIQGPGCTYPTLPGLPLAPCPRAERNEARGSGENYRVPVADEFRVRDANGVNQTENRPDLSYEIPALLTSDPQGGFYLPGGWPVPPWNALVNPLGMDEAPSNSMDNLFSIDTMTLAWPDTEHSWFLDGELWEIWLWYENLVTPSGIPPRSIVPSGEE